MNVYDLFERIPLPVKPRLPLISGATAWLNSEPITAKELRDKVVLVNFGTSRNLRSSETYVGFSRSFGFANQVDELDRARPYTLPLPLRINEWGIQGDWTVRRDLVVVNKPNATLAYRFRARDLNLVVAPSDMTSPIRFRVSVDGLPPQEAHGLDVDDNGAGIISEPRLYQLIRQPAPIEDRLFEIEFLDGGAELFCFTFG